MATGAVFKGLLHQTPNMICNVDFDVPVDFRKKDYVNGAFRESALKNNYCALTTEGK